MFFLLRFFHFHQHTVDEELDHESPHHHDHDHAGHDHDCGHHAHGHHAHAHQAHPLNSISWIGMLLGLGIHTLLDGDCASLNYSSRSRARTWSHRSGWFWRLSSSSSSQAARRDVVGILDASSRRFIDQDDARQFWLCLSGSTRGHDGRHFRQPNYRTRSIVCRSRLSIFSRVFLCIALSDLLPEMEFHSHHRLPLSVSLITGSPLLGDRLFRASAPSRCAFGRPTS